MQLILDNLSKKYPKNKLFENINYKFEINKAYAITGENGSGKSTLIKIMAGVTAPTKGDVVLVSNGKTVEKEKIFQFLSITAPYLDLIEEFTLKEHLEFHAKFKKVRNGANIDDEIEAANLSKSMHKTVSEFSSGMKQRLKLILCCAFESKILLLDEPTSHLDTKGVDWYKSLISRCSNDRIIIIASNDPMEYTSFTQEILEISKN
jgi:ABC-type multidrug transport system ATPase subunit